jgi:hypothetical protein
VWWGLLKKLKEDTRVVIRGMGFLNCIVIIRLMRFFDFSISMVRPVSGSDTTILPGFFQDVLICRAVCVLVEFL